MMQKPIVPLITLNNGIKMPQIGLGVYEDKFAIENTAKAVLSVFEHGYSRIYTAAANRNEVEVGKAIKQSGIKKKELFITTKVRDDDQGYESTLKAYDTSLSKLQLDYIDLYLVH